MKIKFYWDGNEIRWWFLVMIYAALFLLLLACSAKADSVPTTKIVAQEIKFDSALPMNMTVATDLASNLLAAQAASPWLNSLDLSIAAVLRAIGLYVYPGGPQQISLACCPAVWAQSTVAIDPNAGLGITPAAVNFGEVPIGTPEPSFYAFVVCGLLFFWALSLRGSRERRT